MTRRDYLIKWGVYALALLPVWFLENYVLNRFPVLGVVPMLLPLAAIAVAVLEGGIAGAGFGLAVGLLCDAIYFHTNGAMTISLALLGAGAGIGTRYGLRQNLLGCFLCSAGSLAIIDLMRVILRLFKGYPLSALLAVALPEIIWSLVFVFPIYGIFLWVYRRVPKRTHF